ncbi:MAG TPA: TetR/AcrR family transcriptional regulator [Tepidiformaceae bacterium]|nr:TetR/AcrR family transcriptional regulator [Tepidiformaceae bacterium]HNO66681.1 TetR/AcrR family transcriptional regulator [Tepidiformaceae bacterium]
MAEEQGTTFGLRGHRMLDPDKSETRRREVLHAAARVFSENGFHASTTEDIARAMGSSKGVIYYYFRSKEEIYLEVVSTAILGAQERLELILAQALPPAETLREAIRIHLAYNLNEQEEGYYAMLVIKDVRTTAPEVRDEVRALQRRYIKRFESIIRRGVESGDFEPLDPAVTNLNILSAVNYASDWFRPNGRMDLDEVIDHIADQLVAGVLKRGPAGGAQ